ncbi:hypothetical protein MTR62_01665 [Novosphingobium sp. 1949]|uniref:Uncharacterized protein n=1 Tax=Novosphingobium organovorum TaxID=2930092 RepID=A0ABT0B914_9SPHN|nr:hypothetical protein [Novosphingobium organovorum]MCJ2181419.1 hypothetical protein [Novosphingobium organovorum]
MIVPDQIRPSRRCLAGLVAFAVALCPALASAAQTSLDTACLTRDEARSVLTYSLPQVIDGTARRCRAVLPANAFLTTHGQDVVQRYSTNRQAYWPDARAAFVKLAARRDASFGRIAAQMDDAALKPLVDATVSGLVEQAIKPETCQQIDLAIDLLAPLPPRNTAGLITLFIELAARADKLATQHAEKPVLPRELAICKD